MRIVYVTNVRVMRLQCLKAETEKCAAQCHSLSTWDSRAPQTRYLDPSQQHELPEEMASNVRRSFASVIQDEWFSGFGHNNYTDPADLPGAYIDGFAGGVSIHGVAR